MPCKVCAACGLVWIHGSAVQLPRTRWPRRPGGDPRRPGDVGSALPEPALFEATRRTLSVDHYDCFYLSNNPDHLDVAKDLGMATGLFVTGSEAAPETEHTIVRGFEDLLRSRGA